MNIGIIVAMEKEINKYRIDVMKIPTYYLEMKRQRFSLTQKGH